MKKWLSLILSLALCFGLFGCASDEDHSDENADDDDYSLRDVMIAEAVAQAELVGLCAGEDYMALMTSNEELVSKAQQFTAFDDEPACVYICNEDVEGMYQQVLTIYSTTEGSSMLAAVSSLACSTILNLSEELEDAAAILVQYGTFGSALVIFTPVKDGVANMVALPLTSMIAGMLRSDFYDFGNPIGAEEVQGAMERAEEYDEKLPGKKAETNADHYASLAKRITESLQPISEEQALELMGSADVARLLVQMSEAMQLTSVESAVYRSTDRWMNDIEQNGLAAVSNQQLRDHVISVFHMSVVNRFCAGFGVEQISASSGLSRFVDPGYLGVVTEDLDDDCILAALEFTDEWTAVLCFFDTGRGFLGYRIGCLPCDIDGLENLMASEYWLKLS